MATPGAIAAGILTGNPLMGLGVGALTTAGTTAASYIGDKVAELHGRYLDKKRFREAQNQLLAENGMLYYQPPLKYSGNVVTSDMAENKNLSLILKNKDMSAISPELVIGVEKAVRRVADNAGVRIPVAEKVSKVANAVNNLAYGVAIRPRSFSEDSLLSIDEDTAKGLAEDIKCESDSERAELEVDRLESILDSNSVEILNEELESVKNKPKSFSECSNLNSILKSKDFSLSTVFSGLSSILSKDKIVKNIGKASKVIEKARDNATEAASTIANKASKEGITDKVSKGIGSFIGNIKKSFETSSGVKSPDAGESKPHLSIYNPKDDVEPDVPENPAPPSEVKTKLSSLDPKNLSKTEYEGVKLASNNKLAAKAAEKFGYDTVGRASKAVKSMAATSAAEAARKEKARAEAEANRNANK